jgi:small nuclear ribonucleoprotein (snRNP)-like protein
VTVAAVAVLMLWPIVVVGLVFAGLTWHRRSTAVLLAERARRQVIVTLKTDDAFRGLLHATDREALVLREAHALAFGAKKVNVIVEGEVLLLRNEVAYIQVLPSTTPAVTA